MRRQNHTELRHCAAGTPIHGNGRTKTIARARRAPDSLARFNGDARAAVTWHKEANSTVATNQLGETQCSIGSCRVGLGATSKLIMAIVQYAYLVGISNRPRAWRRYVGPEEECLRVTDAKMTILNNNEFDS